MRLVTLRGITTSAILVMALTHAANAADNAGATLVRPRQDSTVAPQSEVTGKVLTRGWPIVLVRADLPECLWWAQEWAEPTSATGYFKAKVRFGNDKSKDGSRFRVVVVIAKSEEDARRYKPGASFKRIPEDLPKSTETVVVLKRQTLENEPVADVIKSPAADSEVGRIANVVGRTEKDLQPVVLVRSVETNSLWWVQPPSELDGEGNFTTLARFGNERTPKGTHFKLMVIFPTKAQAKGYRPSEPVRQLPRDMVHSEEVEVRRVDPVEGPQPISATAIDG